MASGRDGPAAGSARLGPRCQLCFLLLFNDPTWELKQRVPAGAQGARRARSHTRNGGGHRFPCISPPLNNSFLMGKGVPPPAGCSDVRGPCVCREGDERSGAVTQTGEGDTGRGLSLLWLPRWIPTAGNAQAARTRCILPLPLRDGGAGSIPPHPQPGQGAPPNASGHWCALRSLGSRLHPCQGTN